MEILINMDNEAFRDKDGEIDPEFEVKRILKKYVMGMFGKEFLECDTLYIRDINGNKCGYIKILPREKKLCE